MYRNTCPSEANFALLEPARSTISQKKAGSSPPKARKLEARTSLNDRLLKEFTKKLSCQLSLFGVARAYFRVVILVLRNTCNSIACTGRPHFTRYHLADQNSVI